MALRDSVSIPCLPGPVWPSIADRIENEWTCAIQESHDCRSALSKPQAQGSAPEVPLFECAPGCSDGCLERLVGSHIDIRCDSDTFPVPARMRIHRTRRRE